MSPDEMRSPRDALAEARRLGLTRLDALVLLGHVLRRSRAWLLAHDDTLLDNATAQTLTALFVRRLAGEPVAYLVGRHEFFGLELKVTPAVLDPRPDTEILVEWALERLDGLPSVRPAPEVLDLGTGSGAIALAIQAERPRVRVTAVDRSAAALELAHENAQQLGLPVRFMLGDWFSALGTQRFDVIVSNPPYLAETDPHLASLHAEPREALVAGVDGLDALRHLASMAPRHLQPGGAMLLEHGATQADAVAELLALAGFELLGHRHDLAGHARCTGGRLP